MDIYLVVGNPKANSKTLAASKLLADTIADKMEEYSVKVGLKVADLALLSGEMFNWESEKVQNLVKEVAASDLLIVATPTYKATYTGLLKAFLDLFPYNGLTGKAAIPVMTGAAPNHSMAVETFLRPLLIELGAMCPTKGIYILESDLDKLPALFDAWSAEAEKSLGLLFGA